jgi:UDP-N-acetylmuramyl pentapeptide phosphotransferase/UDP-N-acetylglucosamine-1-phosphate transferase
MNNKINLEDVEKNAHRLLSQDGLMEILMGLIMFVTSSTFSGTSVFTPFLALYVIFMRSIIEAFRKRFTYPRIGYIKLQDQDAKNIGKGILTFVGVIMIAIIVFIYLVFGTLSGNLVYRWIPSVMGMILFGGLIYNYKKTDDKINLVYLIIAVFTGIGFSIIEFPYPKDGPQLYLLLMSGLFIVAGVLRFLKFRNSHPVIDIDEDIRDE